MFVGDDALRRSFIHLASDKSSSGVKVAVGSSLMVPELSLLQPDAADWLQINYIPSLGRQNKISPIPPHAIPMTHNGMNRRKASLAIGSIQLVQCLDVAI